MPIKKLCHGIPVKNFLEFIPQEFIKEAIARCIFCETIEG
jgi:hypothetical protein